MLFYHYWVYWWFCSNLIIRSYSFTYFHFYSLVRLLTLSRGKSVDNYSYSDDSWTALVLMVKVITIFKIVQNASNIGLEALDFYLVIHQISLCLPTPYYWSFILFLGFCLDLEWVSLSIFVNSFVFFDNASLSWLATGALPSWAICHFG